MWSVVAFARFLKALLDRPWATRAAAIVACLSLVGALVGWILGWPYYLRFLTWGLVWAIVAVGAWATNR